MAQSPNLIFIMTDHQRADSIGMVQDGKEVTPVLNQLAKESVVFTKAYNTCPLCVPARTALATGKYPTNNGVVFNDIKGKRAQNHNTIHQYVKEAGYTVGHVGIDHIQVNPPLKSRVQFDFWIDDDDYDEYAKTKNIENERTSAYATEVIEFQDGAYVKKAYSNTHTSVWPYPLEQFKDQYFARKASEFIEQQQDDQPFALFLYFWAPHPPLKVPEPYASMFDPKMLILPENVGVPGPKEPANRRRGIAAQLAEDLTMEDWREVWAAHLGLVNMVDSAIGDVLESIKKLGKYEDTVIVFTSDHGDHLGQHKMYQKMEMYDQAIQVPFIYKAPKGKVQQWDVPVSHLDIVPTILEMLNIELPKDLDGISLASSIIGEEAPIGKPVFCQYSGNPTVGDLRRAVIEGQYKYIYDPRDQAELYDLINDPLEMNNLAGDKKYETIEKDLHEKGMNWAKIHGDWVEF
ncbi:MAG: sulfatase-like hydrolase/transferase [Epulopiscium sp.]|nr:sulfatase-like hydrolase/transferase [Candidatus Epulonipiscium sp.]